MGLFNNLKKGVAAFKMAFEKEDLTTGRIIHEIEKFKGSAKYHWMSKGIRYYDVDNDILDHDDPFMRPGKADNRIAHATYKNIVDEKVSYAFSKTPTLTNTKGDDNTYIDLVIETLGKYWDYEIETLAFEASNKAIGWAHPYINEDGDFKMFVPPTEQLVPIWADSSHFRLKAMIRFYDSTVWRFGKEEIVTHVEVWDSDTVSYYRREGGSLILEDRGTAGHFQVDGIWNGRWGKVPFVPFKNNRRELCDLKFVKSIVDNYDLTRSEVANFLQEVKNFIYVLRGYSGDSLEQFLEDILQYRAIVLEGEEEAGVDALTPKIDIQAFKEHYDQLKIDILESGQAVNRNLDRFGSAPSGVALEFLFSGLDLKCDAIESEFRRGFDGLLYFVNKYLEVKNISHTPVDLTILFNHDMAMDEAAIIEAADKSRGIISDETIVANHPWVLDVAKELELLQKQKAADREDFVRAPKLGEDNGSN